MTGRAKGYATAIALVLVSFGSVSAAAPPKREAREARDARRDAREERKEARDAVRHGAPDAKEERKEAREATKEAIKETEEAINARHKRQHELADKANKGPLTDKEKEELHAIREHQREVHRDVVERWAARRAKLVERRRQERRELLAKWGELPKRPKVREEFALHARRTALLHRARHLAEINEKPELAERLDKIMARENARHAHRMDVLKGEK